MNTMGQILQNWRILTATLFSATLVISAYILARNIESPQLAQASTETALLQAIATRDSDGDGLSDWEESLYGTDSHITDSFNLGMTDGEAVAKGLVVPKTVADISVSTSSPTSFDSDGLPPPPAEGTLTATFARNFFTLYLSAKQANGGADLSQNDIQNITNKAIQSLSSIVTVAHDFKSMEDLTISGSGVDALKKFAVQVENVLKNNTSKAKKSEILYLQDAVQNNDTEAIAYIIEIANGYRNSATGLSILPVPKELATDYLSLINSMMRVSEISNDFARVNDDTLAAILALQQYPQVVLNLWNAFINIGNMYKTEGVSFSSEEPGYLFVNLIEDIISEQSDAKKI